MRDEKCDGVEIMKMRDASCELRDARCG